MKRINNPHSHMRREATPATPRRVIPRDFVEHTCIFIDDDNNTYCVSVRIDMCSTYRLLPKEPIYFDLHLISYTTVIAL